VTRVRLTTSFWMVGASRGSFCCCIKSTEWDRRQSHTVHKHCDSQRYLTWQVWGYKPCVNDTQYKSWKAAVCSAPVTTQCNSLTAFVMPIDTSTDRWLFKVPMSHDSLLSNTHSHMIGSSCVCRQTGMRKTQCFVLLPAETLCLALC